MHFRLNSFRARTALIVLLLFFPTFALVMDTADKQRQLAIDKARSDALALTNSIAADNQQYIEAGHQLLTALAELPVVRNKQVEPCNSLFAALLDEYATYNSMFVVDVDTGMGFCSAIPYTNPVDDSSYAWYQEAVTTEQFVVSPYRIGPISGRPGVTMALPAYDSQGRLTAVVAVTLSLNWLDKSISTSKVPDGTTITLVDSNDTVLARHPSSESSLVGRPYTNRAVLRAAHSKEAGTIRAKDAKHQSRLYGFTQMGPEAGSINVIVGLPEGTILADAQRIRNQNLLILAGITLLMTILASVGSTFITRPITQLTRACRDMIEGQQTERPLLDTPIMELRQLLGAFNEMTSAVETRMRERMVDLEAANTRLHDEIFERTQAEARTRILQELAADLSEAVSTKQVARIIIEKGLLPAGSVACAIATRSRDQEVLVFIDQHGVGETALEKFFTTPLSKKLPIVDVYHSGKALWIQNEQEYAALYPEIFEKYSSSRASSMVVLPLVVGGQVIGSLFATFDQPRVFDQADRVLLCTIADYCAQALERSRLYEDEIRARHEAEHTAEQIARLYSLATDLSDALTPQEVATTVVSQGAMTLGAVSAAFNLLNSDGETLSLLYRLGGKLSGESLEQWQSYPLDPAYPITEVIEKKRSLWFSSIDEIVARYPAMASLSTLYAGASVLVPLIVEGEAIGAMTFSFNEPRSFNDEDHIFIMALAQQGAQAFERTRLAEKSRETAALEERQRLARDLHDAVSQTLFSSTTIAESLPRQWERRPERALELVSQVVTLNRAAMAEMRTLLLELRPDSIINTELKILLRQLIDAATGRKRIQTDLVFSGDGALGAPPNVHVTFYRIAQECINNILKHSQATQFTVNLEQAPARIALQITDNGCGFDMGKMYSGLGLHNIRERAESIGAALDMQSQIGAGTSVRVEWHNGV